MRLSDLLAEDRVTTSLTAPNKDVALDALARLLAPGAGTLGAEAIARVLRSRELLASTGVGDEVAIPHGRVAGLTQIIAALAVAPDGIAFDAIDHRPVRIFVVILAPDRAPGDQLRALARVSRLLRDVRVRDRILAAPTPAELLRVIQDEEIGLT